MLKFVSEIESHSDIYSFDCLGPGDGDRLFGD